MAVGLENTPFYKLLARSLKKEGVTQIFVIDKLELEGEKIFLEEGVKLINFSTSCNAAEFVKESKGAVSVPVCLLLVDDQENRPPLFGEYAFYEVCLNSNDHPDQWMRNSISVALQNRLPVYVRVLNGAFNSDAPTHVLEKKEIPNGAAGEVNDVIFDSQPSDVLDLYGSLHLLFGKNMQDLNENLKNDGEANCNICLDKIFNKDFVISYDICKGKHIFHMICVEKLCGKKLCPLDRSPLAGPCRTWIYRRHHVPDDEDDNLQFLSTPKFNVAERFANIENECSDCSKPYQVGDEKTTLLSCSHTFCNMCFEVTMTTCPVCGEPSEPYNCDSGDYEAHHMINLNMRNASEDMDIESVIPLNVSQAYDGASQEMGRAGQQMVARRLDFDMIHELEDLLGTRQEGDQIQENEEPPRHQNEVNNNEVTEEPAWDEEMKNAEADIENAEADMENAEADSSIETLEIFWDTSMFDQ